MKRILTHIIQKRILNKLINNREKGYVHIPKAKEVLFSFDINTQDIKPIIGKFVSFFQSNNINYTGIAIDTKEESNSLSSYISNPHIIPIFREEMNWYLLPNQEILKKVNDTKHDIYIDFSLEGNASSFPCKYFLRKSNAKLKIGFDKNKEKEYDLFFNNSKNIDYKSFYDNVIQHLNNIN